MPEERSPSLSKGLDTVDVASSDRARYGFVGTGAITRAMVEGLSTLDDPPAIVVSPRGARVSAALAERFGNVTVAADNQAVVDAATCVVLAPRPLDAPAVLEALTFRADQVVVSVVAALPLATLLDAVAPATRVARAIPLPSVAARQGLVPVVPPEPTALELFGRLGEVVALDDEVAFDSFSAASAFAATQLDLLATVEAWLAGQGVPARQARAYVGTLLRGLSDALAEEPDRELGALADDHATPGGLNQQVREDVRAAGTHEVVGQALDDVLARVRGARA